MGKLGRSIRNEDDRKMNLEKLVFEQFAGWTWTLLKLCELQSSEPKLTTSYNEVLFGFTSLFDSCCIHAVVIFWQYNVSVVVDRGAGHQVETEFCPRLEPLPIINDTRLTDFSLF